MESCCIGMDIGGTYVRTGLYDQKRQIMAAYHSRPFTRETTAEKEIKANICEEIKAMLTQHQISVSELKGIGISMAGSVCPVKGTVVRWPNHPLWEGFPIYDYLCGEFSSPIVMEDDGNCAAIGESLELTKEPSYKGNLIYCAIGTGIGCGIILGHKLHKGDFCMSGELGHLPIPGMPKKCVCGKTGCLQTLIADRTVQENAGAGIARVLYQMAYILDIRRVVLGGGQIEHSKTLFGHIKEAFLKCGEADKRDYTIVKSRLYNKNGIHGAVEILRLAHLKV